MNLEILSVDCEWHEQYANRPSFKIVFNKEPAGNDVLRYVERGGLYVAVADPIVNFYAYTQPGKGFGGREFKITMKNGEQRTLIGPWSSNSGCVNELFPEIGGVVEVTYNYPGNKYSLWYSGAVTVSSISRWLMQSKVKDELAEVFDLPKVKSKIGIAKVKQFEDQTVYYEPTVDGIIKKDSSSNFKVVDADWNYLKPNTKEEGAVMTSL